jgi:Ca-activated chloride channel family protein
VKPIAAALLAATALAVPERWLHNARERTAEGRARWEQGDFPAAARALDQALELGGEEAALQFNAGSGHLAAGTPGLALPLLQRAADAAALAPAGSPAAAMRPDALYNLGNAHLAAGDPQAAADAYRACLRQEPGHQPAKHNLELALQQAGQPSPQQAPGEQGEPRPGDTETQPQGEGGDGPREDGQGQPEGARPPPEGDGGAGPPPRPERSKRSPRLPRFDPQEDMSAEQAANLLEAVENLEREQRRAQADEERRQRARRSTEKDW